MRSLPLRTIASASASDHQPMPTQATRRGSLTAARADRLDRLARDARVELEAAARHADAADAFAAEEDRGAAFHRGPALGARGHGEAERVRDVERLALRAPGSRGAAGRGR